jgi:hypothetical protein
MEKLSHTQSSTPNVGERPPTYDTASRQSVQPVDRPVEVPYHDITQSVLQSALRRKGESPSEWLERATVEAGYWTKVDRASEYVEKMFPLWVHHSDAQLVTLLVKKPREKTSHIASGLDTIKQTALSAAVSEANQTSFISVLDKTRLRLLGGLTELRARREGYYQPSEVYKSLKEVYRETMIESGWRERDMRSHIGWIRPPPSSWSTTRTD